MTINKRALLHGGLTISAALAAQAHRVTTAAKADACEMPPVGGEFRCDADVLPQRQPISATSFTGTRRLFSRLRRLPISPA